MNAQTDMPPRIPSADSIIVKTLELIQDDFRNGNLDEDEINALWYELSSIAGRMRNNVFERRPIDQARLSRLRTLLESPASPRSIEVGSSIAMQLKTLIENVPLRWNSETPTTSPTSTRGAYRSFFQSSMRRLERNRLRATMRELRGQ